MSSEFPAATAHGAAVDVATVIDFFGALITPKATAATTAGTLDVAEHLVPAGLATPLHVHHREDECFYLLDGVVAFRCVAETIVAQAGTFVRLPRDTPHAFRVRSETPARMLVLCLPSGLVAFYAAVGIPAGQGATAVLRPVDVPRLVQVHTSPRHRVHIWAVFVADLLPAGQARPTRRAMTHCLSLSTRGVPAIGA